MEHREASAIDKSARYPKIHTAAKAIPGEMYIAVGASVGYCAVKYPNKEDTKKAKNTIANSEMATRFFITPFLTNS